MTEEWRTCPGYEHYQVSNLGQVRSIDRWVDYANGRRILHKGRNLKSSIDKDGYRRVTVYRDKKQIVKGAHALVCEAFHGMRPDGFHAAHRDGDKSNNNATNLYWASPSQNEQDKVAHGENPQANKTHCPSGHAYDAENTIHVYRRNRPGNERQCRRCKANRDSAHQRVNRDKANARNRLYRARKKEKAAKLQITV